MRRTRRSSGDLGLLRGLEPEMMEEADRGGLVARPGSPASRRPIENEGPDHDLARPLVLPRLDPGRVTTADILPAARPRTGRRRRRPRDRRCPTRSPRPSRRSSRSTGRKRRIRKKPWRCAGARRCRTCRNRVRSIFGSAGTVNPDDFISFDYGSGVVVGDQGQILTAFHVVRGADRLRVRAAGQPAFEAEVIAADPRSDLAVIAPRAIPGVDAPRLKPLAIGDASRLRKGAFLIALGNPFNAAQTAAHRRAGASCRTWPGA